MADFSFNPAAAYRPRGSELELADVSRSRAHSYLSSSTTSYFRTDDDQESLISHDWKSPRQTSVKGIRPAGRVLSTASTLSQTPTVSRERKRKLQGWRFGVSCSAWIAFAVFLLNVIFTIYASSKFPIQDGVGTAYTGSCDYVNKWTTWLHILINALSSILLSASNYTMQCLCSPTRKEINRAHARGDWMDIGVASVRNMHKIRWPRAILWWALALSSIPIHLLYNSAVFKSLAANDYTVVLVNDKWLDGGNFTVNLNYTISDHYSSMTSALWDLSDLTTMQQIFTTPSWENSTEFQNLSASDCIGAYGTSFVSGRDMLAVITEQVNPDDSNYTLFWYDSAYSLQGAPSYDWMCIDSNEEDCDPPSLRQEAADWTIIGAKVDHCISRLTPSYCKLQFSRDILITVILMNLCKTIVMFLTLYWQKEHTLVTVGDALASFLERPDEITKGRCLMAKSDVHQGPLRWALKGSKNTPSVQPLPSTYHTPTRRRWFSAASKKRWIVTMSLCSIAIIAGASLLVIGEQNLAGFLGAGQSPFSLGFGAVDARALVDISLPQSGTSGLVAAVLLANLPQAIVSFLYLTYNGLFTCMLLCHEYSKYAIRGRKKPLRVTTPRGLQRSTYYLNLPFPYSLPLIIASGTLHWLISESIFLARIDEYDVEDGNLTESNSSSQVGYSCLPILLTLLLGSIMLLTALGMGMRKFASTIPVAGSCSVALAAACHRPKEDVDAAYLAVHWGEVNAEGTDEVGHCCFTSDEVQDLLPGRMYAGARSVPSTGTASDNDGTSEGLRARQRSSHFEI